jgi:hypothetical protein
MDILKKDVVKWDSDKQEYEDYTLPEGSSLYETDMNKIVSCACCGKKLKFGNCYTSRTIYNTYGLGYAICKNCHRKEV